MRARNRPSGPADMPRHLVEFDPTDWLDVDVSCATNYGTDAHRYIELRRRNAFTQARHRWLVDHGLVER